MQSKASSQASDDDSYIRAGYNKFSIHIKDKLRGNLLANK